MAKTSVPPVAKKFKDIDTYISAQNENIQPSLNKLREVILKAIPKAQETIAWSMPTFKHNTKTIIHFAAFKNHYSVFVRPRYLDHFRDELDQYKTTKSAINIPNDKPVPVQLITRIVQHALVQEQLTVDG